MRGPESKEDRAAGPLSRIFRVTLKSVDGKHRESQEVESLRLASPLRSRFC